MEGPQQNQIRFLNQLHRHAVTIVDGVPTPVYVKPVTKDDIQRALLLSLNKKYEGRYDEIQNTYVHDDPATEGMTKLEATVHQLTQKACHGHLKAIEQVLDRALGKPMQYVDQTPSHFRPFVFIPLFINRLLAEVNRLYH